MAVAGALKFAPLILWMYLCLQMKDGSRRRILLLIPYSGVVMVILSALAYLTEYTRQLLWRADRLGGTFQYSNTMALYLLTGIHVLCYSEPSEDKRGRNLRAAAIIVLCIGLLLTGSRSILLLAAVWALVTAVRKDSLRKGILIMTASMIALIMAYVLISGSYQNIGRILTLFSNNSTILGRILYVKDAVRMLMIHPFGLGWQGYYRLQPVLQHGVYTTRYVHNEYIQTALDLGIVPAIILAGYIIWQIVRGRQGEAEKGILILIAAACLMDFHMQYLSIGMMAVLCLDLQQDQGSMKTKQGTAAENIILAAIPLLVFAYFFIAFASFRLGADEYGLRFYPYYTDAKLRLLERASSPEEAVRLAGEVTDLAPTASRAYVHLASAASLRGDTGAMCENMDKAIECARYDVDCYRLYDTLIEDAVARGDLSSEETRRLTTIRDSLPQRLSALKEDTDPLAFKLRDVPVFTF